MLLKFLPFSQKKEKNQSPSLKGSLQNEKQNKAFLNLGLNLLSGTDTSSTVNASTKKSKFISNSSDKLTILFKKLILILCTSLSCLVIVNVFTLQIIKSLKVKQGVLVQQVSAYSEVEVLAKDVNRRVSYYKKVLSQRKSISPKVEFITNKTGSDIYVKDIKYTSNGFSIFAEGPDAYTFTRLISEYLSGGIVSEVSIKGARLNTRTGVFEINMEGVFK
ncbi:MAG: hypothetical protein WAX66_02010 [Patescibacteria group bacterium]